MGRSGDEKKILERLRPILFDSFPTIFKSLLTGVQRLTLHCRSWSMMSSSADWMGVADWRQKLVFL